MPSVSAASATDMVSLISVRDVVLRGPCVSDGAKRALTLDRAMVWWRRETNNNRVVRLGQVLGRPRNVDKVDLVGVLGDRLVVVGVVGYHASLSGQPSGALMAISAEVKRLDARDSWPEGVVS